MAGSFGIVRMLQALGLEGPYLFLAGLGIALLLALGTYFICLRLVRSPKKRVQ